MLKITVPDKWRLDLEYTGEEISGGQHGSPLVFQEKKSTRKFILKPFYSVIDPEFSQLNAIDVDLSWDAARSKDRCQFGRIANEIVASRLANQHLGIRVPFSFPVVSSKVAKFKIKPKKRLPLDPKVKVLDESELETFEEYYHLQDREMIKVKPASDFDELLLSRCPDDNPSDASFVMGMISEYIPNSVDLASAMDKASDEGRLDEWIDDIRGYDNGYELLPYDTWLNDPDRNNQNYLVQEEETGKTIWGIDYEMFSFGADVPDQDDSTKGRSYLAAILHKNTNLGDPRILKTLLKIRMLSKGTIEDIVRLPFPLLQYVEFHIAQGNLEPDEREKINTTEQELFDCLYETKPKMSRLEKIVENQLGSPQFDHPSGRA